MRLRARCRPALAEGASPTLQKIKDAGTITIGHRDSSVPFSYLDDNQKPIGFSLDLCGLVVAKIQTRIGLPNIRIAYQAVNSSNRIPLVKNGTVDIECGSTANTIARQQEVAYSVIFYAPQFKWLALKSSGVKSTDDLKGKAVVVTQGTNTAQFVARLNTEKGLGMKILQGKDHAESFLLAGDGIGSRAAFDIDRAVLDEGNAVRRVDGLIGDLEVALADPGLDLGNDEAAQLERETDRFLIVVEIGERYGRIAMGDRDRTGVLDLLQRLTKGLRRCARERGHKPKPQGGDANSEFRHDVPSLFQNPQIRARSHGSSRVQPSDATAASSASPRRSTIVST